MALYGRSVTALFDDDYNGDVPKWASNFHPSPIKRKNVLYVLSVLRNILPHNRWYIGGSVANPEVYFKDCNDIDIFFFSMEDYNTAQAAVGARNDCKLDRTSNSAETYIIKNLGLRVQLIKKHVGTPTEIFDTHDLNVAKYLVHAEGQQIAGVDDKDLIEIINPNSASITRVRKYIGYLRYDAATTKKVWENIIDTHISNDDFVKDYYDESGDKTHNKPFNSILYKKLRYTRSLKPYLDEKALEHAPELLI